MIVKVGEKDISSPFFRFYFVDFAAAGVAPLFASAAPVVDFTPSSRNVPAHLLKYTRCSV